MKNGEKSLRASRIVGKVYKAFRTLRAENKINTNETFTIIEFHYFRVKLF